MTSSSSIDFVSLFEFQYHSRISIINCFHILNFSLKLIALPRNWQPPYLDYLQNHFYLLFQDTIPQRPGKHVSSRYFANIKRGCNVSKMLKLFLLLFSVNVIKHQIIAILCHRSVHTSHSANKTEYNRRAKFSQSTLPS